MGVGKRGGSPFVPQRVTPRQRCSMLAVTRSEGWTQLFMSGTAGD